MKYQTHVENIGYKGYVGDGNTSGTQGESKRLEAIRIKLGSNVDGGIRYRTHIQNVGWESSWAYDGNMSGTQGQSLRLEVIQIELTGNAVNQYDVYYRVHAQNFGWMGWAKNGESAGTEAYGYRKLEAIQIQLVNEVERHQERQIMLLIKIFRDQRKMLIGPSLPEFAMSMSMVNI